MIPAAACDPEHAPWLAVDASGDQGQIMLGTRPFRPAQRSLWDPARRVVELDRLGVQAQIVCATPVMFGYGWPASAAADWAARMNDRAPAFCRDQPGRLHALAQVPLQDLDLACAEASRARAAGCVGVQIGNHLGDHDLDHESLVRQDCPRLPSSYARRFHVDSAVFDPGALQLLVGVMGAERVMLCSDHPFPLGEQRIGALAAGAGFLADADRARILAGNARQFVGLHDAPALPA